MQTKELIQFRSLIPAPTSKQDIKYIYGKTYLKQLDKQTLKQLTETNNQYIQTKTKIAKQNTNKLLVSNWVKFIAISGSIASKFPKQKDDIDIFIVVKNNTSWIYRLTIQIKNIFNNTIRTKRNKNITDKLCLNLICEEKSLTFPEDIFTFNELMYLKPIYNNKYINYIYSQNKWLITKYNIKKEHIQTKITPTNNTNIIIKTLNTIAFYLQLLFMLITFHKPNIKTLKQEYKQGKISFYEENFKKEKLENYTKEFKSNN